MSLTVEDGTGVAAAESYISVADFDTYWALRTLDVTYIAAGLATATTTQKEEALRISAQELDAENHDNWKGNKATAAQGLDWPRFNAFDADGHAFDSTTVPTELEALLSERAARYIANVATGLLPDTAAPVGGIMREKLKAGPVELDTTFSGGASQSQQFQKLDTLLGYLIDNDGSTIIRA